MEEAKNNRPLVSEGKSVKPLKNLIPLETLPDAKIKRNTRLMARLLETSFAQITLKRADDELYDSSYLADRDEIVDTSLPISEFFSVLGEPAVIPDINEEERFAGERLTVGGKTFRSFAGVMIHWEETPVGAVLVCDQQPRSFSDLDIEQLRLVEDRILRLVPADRSWETADQQQRTIDDYHEIIDNLPVGVYRSKPSGDILSANSTLTSILGADSVDELKAHDAEEFYVDADRRDEIVETLRETGSVHEEKVRFRRLDGEKIWVALSMRQVEEDGDRYFDGISQDITKRVVQERQLQETLEELKEARYSRDHFKKIVDTVPGGLLILTPDRHIDFVNESLLEMLDYRTGELLGEDVGTILGTEARRDDDAELSNPEESTYEERTFMAKEGDEVPVLFSASTLKDGEGDLQKIVCVGVDLTERKEAQRALAESEERFRQMAENINELIFMYSSDWSEMHYVNPRYEDLWGRPHEGLKEDPLDFMQGIHPDDREGVREALQRTTEGEEITIEYRVNENEDYQRWVVSDAVPVKNEEGEIIRMVGTVREITDLKKTQRRLEAALSEKKSLLKEIHHRVKTNMQIISSIVNLHEQKNQDAPNEMMRDCKQRIQSMAMVHDVIYQSDNLAELDFNQYLDQLVSSVLQNQAPDLSVDVTIDVDASIQLPVSEAVPCGLILHELVKNSCKHAFASDRENELVVRVEDAGDRIVLRVQDNGPGFPGDFDPEGSNTIGFEILRNLGEYELDGWINYSSDPMTTVELEFPVSDD